MTTDRRKKSRCVCADVALPLPVGGIYSYSIPENWVAQVRVGCRVLVPIRNTYTTGFVIKVRQESDRSHLKAIGDVLDTEPLFHTHLLRLTRWISDYYLCPWGEVLKAALPAGMHQESQQTIRLKEFYADRLLEKVDRHIVHGSRIIQAVYEKGEIRFSQLVKRVGEEGLRITLKELEKKGYIEIQKNLRRARVGLLYERWVALRHPDQITEDHVQKLRRRAPRQAECLDILLGIEGKTIPTAELKKKYGIDGSVLQRMKTTGLIEFVKKEVIRDPYRDIPIHKGEKLKLTPEQSKVLRRIVSAVASRSFRVFLLHGVTGSGKTEVYIRAIKTVLKHGKQAIVLVPEIALTSQTAIRFREHFAHRIAVLHSRLSLGERYDMWRQIEKDAVDVVIGARSAVFAPVKRLGIIIVDEEHETAYKQSECVPRYHARDVAVMRGQLSKAIVLLGSATPSLESYSNATAGKYVKCELPRRIDDLPLPPVTVVDMCEERKEGNWGIFSRLLQDKMKAIQEKQQQIILLQNRRGFSSYIQCEQCGYVATCRECNVTLTYHAAERSLRCHYCNAHHGAPTVCPECGGYRLRYMGVGTQRIEKEIQRRFPNMRVLRMDVDTTSRKGAHDRILRLFKGGEADVLLGTQMVAKGLDFPRVTLVGVIDADVGLNLPDFRACERTFQLLTQVAGRAGRSKLGGEVVIQTYSPDHPSVALAEHHDYGTFYERELEQRRELRYPPVSRLVSLLIQGKREDDVEKCAVILTETIRTFAKEKRNHSVEVLGPAPAPFTKLVGNYRWQTILKGNASHLLRACISAGFDSLKTEGYSRGTKVIVDVDPVDML